MDFVSGVTWRRSKRGLVVCGPGGSSLLVEHDRAADLPALLDAAASAEEVSALLGGSDADRQLAADLVAERIVVDPVASVANLLSNPRNAWCSPALVWSSPASIALPILGSTPRLGWY
jgi:hypothetical protein